MQLLSRTIQSSQRPLSLWFSFLLLFPSLFLGCSEYKKNIERKELERFELLKKTLKKGDDEAKRSLDHYLIEYRERSIGDPFAEVRDSPYAQEAIKIYTHAHHHLVLDQRWHEAWRFFWEESITKGEQAFKAILADYQDELIGNPYQDELKRILKEISSQQTPSQLSPEGVRWVGVKGASQKKGASTKQGICVAQSEVTVAQYRACVEAKVCSIPDEGGRCLWGTLGHDRQPINCVDWNQAQQYSKWVGGRLPLIKEWIYIAQSGSLHWNYPWGDEEPRCVHGVLSGNEETCTQTNSNIICRQSEGHSAQGVCDLVGNLSEWLMCDGEECFQNERRHIGGSWRSVVYSLSLKETQVTQRTYRYYDLGFRPIRECFSSALILPK